MMSSLYTIQRHGTQSLYLPEPVAGSPWSPAAQHGGPPCALLAGAIEALVDDPDLRPAHFRAELFRVVPMKPLRLETEVLRRGRRLVSADARLVSDEVVARASALFLPRGACSVGDERGERALPGPDARLAPMIPLDHEMKFPPGFHNAVEVETLEARRLQCAWVRIPCDFLPGKPLTAFQRAAATSDFCNALRARQLSHEAGFVNVDSSVQFLRPGDGEWLGLELLDVADSGATGFARATLFDEHGVFATVLQNSLARRRHTGD